MNYSVLRALLSSVNGATFISIDTLTKVELTGGKTNPFYDRIQKRVVGSNVMVFQNKKLNGYENMVQRRLIDEGKDPTLFELSPRAWGRRLPNCPFVEYRGKYYLEVIFLRHGEIEYLLDGRPFPKQLITGLDDHEEPAQGGLKKKVILRTYACESITGLMVNHMRFIIRL